MPHFLKVRILSRKARTSESDRNSKNVHLGTCTEKSEKCKYLSIVRVSISNLGQAYKTCLMLPRQARPQRHEAGELTM